jgi:phosphatidylglycerol:prolipoprotein diacylglycerol transferase
MYPTLLIGTVAIPTYPLLMLLALWAGLWLAAWRAARLGLDGDHIYNAGLYGLITGIIGARLWFVLSHWENYADNLSQALSLSRSALSVPEGLIIAGLAALIYLQRNNVPLGDFVDAAAPGIALTVIIGNTGALLGGQNLGLPTTLPWGIEMSGTVRHPFPLYHALVAAFILAGLLSGISKWRPWPGVQLWLFIIFYSLSWLLLEIFRARPYIIGNGYLAGQVGALIALVVALAVMAYNFTRNKV